jgi:hypothetical protein
MAGKTNGGNAVYAKIIDMNTETKLLLTSTKMQSRTNYAE